MNNENWKMTETEYIATFKLLQLGLINAKNIIRLYGKMLLWGAASLMASLFGNLYFFLSLLIGGN